MSDLDYAIALILPQLYWAWKNWNLRPDSEANKWEGIFLHHWNELKGYLNKKAAMKPAARTSLLSDQSPLQ